MSSQEPPPAITLSDEEQGKILRAWRLAKRLKPDELAERIGRQPATLGEWERGRRHLTVQNREHIARILEIAPEMLLHPPDAYVKGVESGESEEDTASKETDHDGLFRVLMRAARSGPAEYKTRWTPDLDSYWPIEGSGEIIRFATRLLNEAALKNRESESKQDMKKMTEDNTIIMTWCGGIDPLDVVHDSYLHAQWIAALRVALASGWFIQHCIHISGETGTRKAFTSVSNVIAFTGRSGRYTPCLLPEKLSQSAQDVLRLGVDFIVIPSNGILVLYGSDVAHYYEYGSEGFGKWKANVTRLIEGNKNHHKSYRRLSAGRIEAITKLESARGDRYLFMDGLPQNLIPRKILDERYVAVTRIIHESDIPAGDKQVYENLAKTTWQCRKDREVRLRESLDEGRYWCRDIVPVEAINRFVETGQSCFRDINDSFALVAQMVKGKLPEYTYKQRQECLQALMHRVSQYSHYELILLGSLPHHKGHEFMQVEGLVDTQGIYCMLKDKHAIILQFWRAGTPPKDGTLENPVNATPDDYLTIEIDDPRIVRAFMSSPNLRAFGAGQTPAQRKAVLRFLQEQIDELQTKIDVQSGDDA